MGTGFSGRLDPQPLTLRSAAFARSPVAKALLSLAPGAVGQVVEANAAFCALVGRDRTELVGRAGRALFADQDIAPLTDTFDAMARGNLQGAAAERTVVRPDGSRRRVSCHAVVVRDEAGGAYVLDEVLDVEAVPRDLAAPVGAFQAGDEQMHGLSTYPFGGTPRHADAGRHDDPPYRGTVPVQHLERERTALARSEEQFRTAFDASPLGLLIVDGNSRFQQANRAAARLTGRRVEDLIGLTPRDITHPDDRAATERARRTLRAGNNLVYDKRLQRPDGGSVWTRVSLCLIPGPDGQVWRLVQLQDITAERAADAAAARELERLRATLTVKREVTAAAADRDGALRVIAERAVSLFPAADGAAVELVDGARLRFAATAGTLDGCAGARIPVAGSLSGLALSTDSAAHCRDTRTDPRVDGGTTARLGIGAMVVAPLHAEDATIGVLTIAARHTGVFDDTDEQQLALLADSLSSALQHADDAARAAHLLRERTDALAALEASETRFRLTFENSPLGVTLVSLHPADFGRYLQANPAMTGITGYATDELTRMTFVDLQHPEDVAGTTALVHRLADGELDTVATDVATGTGTATPSGSPCGWPRSATTTAAPGTRSTRSRT